MQYVSLLFYAATVVTSYVPSFAGELHCEWLGISQFKHLETRGPEHPWGEHWKQLNEQMISFDGRVSRPVLVVFFLLLLVTEFSLLLKLMSALAAVGPPNPQEHPERCSILHGLEAAVESLCSITEYQHEARKTLMETADRVANRGRIICLTNAKRSALCHYDVLHYIA